MKAAKGERGNLIVGMREGSAVYIGEHVVVTLVQIKGSQIRLSIQAPQDIRIDRAEVIEALLSGEFIQ